LISTCTRVHAPPGVIEIDDSGFPIIAVRFVGSYADDEFRAYLKRMDALLDDQRDMYGLLFDASRAKMPSGRQARLQAAWMRDNAEVVARCTVGTAFVIASPAIRGVLRAILMMQSMSTPYAVEANIAAAEAWLRERLDERSRSAS
jgi:hypothetical protein